ncbi:hypothetical protein [Succinimonas sp.]|uniref:hypothetical protein n=1 Tax=Succinimonas sp. TaxID=1936151 RepID=UPI0038635415
MRDFYTEALVTYRRRYNELFKETGDTVISRVEDGYAKHILHGRVLERLALEMLELFYREDLGTFDIFKGDNEIQVMPQSRTFNLDVFAKLSRKKDQKEDQKEEASRGENGRKKPARNIGVSPDEMYLGLEIQNYTFCAERFFISWAAMAAAQNKGAATKDLRTAPGLIAVISTAGFGKEAAGGIDDLCFVWKSMPCRAIDDKVLGKPHSRGLNLLIINLKKFRQQVKTPKTFLEFYLAFLNCGTYEDIEALLMMDPDGIMEDIIRMDMDFLGNDNLWEPFMKKENKNLLALDIERANHKAEVDEMEKKVAMAEEALEKADAMAERERQAREEAEAMLARERKARVESDAKLFALENAFKDMKSKYDELAALMEKYMTRQPILN